MERRLEEISPLYIEATLALIRKEFADGHRELASGLLQRLQFPLTLGGFQRSLEIGKEYIRRLLTSRMFKGADESNEKAKAVAERLVEGYADHAFCIDAEEAKRIGLTINPIPDDDFNDSWAVLRLLKEKDKIQHEENEKKMAELMRDMQQSSPGSLHDRSIKDDDGYEDAKK